MQLKTEPEQRHRTYSQHEALDSASACLQCHKCTAGCPLSTKADLLPSQIVRLVQLRDIPELLRSRAIWLCSSCRTCSARCPAGVDLARIKDVLRSTCLREGITPGDPRAACAMETVLDSVTSYGRLNELDMMVRYKVRVGGIFENAKLGMAMMRRGKLRLRPARMRKLSELKQLVESGRERPSDR